ncbi:hypothetical protein, partial [Clostridium sp. AM29-11AC]|uniref:hypothetical protein n=1 Tax=Clostridium sp. AM29-11AC TaxID=2293028 RepID=UPI001A9C0B31
GKRLHGTCPFGGSVKKIKVLLYKNTLLCYYDSTIKKRHVNHAWHTLSEKGLQMGSRQHHRIEEENDYEKESIQCNDSSSLSIFPDRLLHKR